MMTMGSGRNRDNRGNRGNEENEMTGEGNNDGGKGRETTGWNHGGEMEEDTRNDGGPLPHIFL